LFSCLGRIGTSLTNKCGPGITGNKMSYHLATYQSQLGPRSAIRVNGAAFDLEEVTAVPNYATVLGVLADWDSADKLLRNVSKDLSKETASLACEAPRARALSHGHLRGGCELCRSCMQDG
jgi:hypothetical protein